MEAWPYPDAMAVGEARERFFAAGGFGDDGGYGARWVKLKSRPVPVYFPNTPGRVRAVRLHDLHHIAAGYDTSWVGEAEVGAWEVAGGCGRYLAAWVLNFGAFTVGLAMAPRRVFRAFVRGRRCRTLYAEHWHDGLLRERLGDLRRRLGLAAAPPRATPGDAAAFAGWVLFLLAWHAAAAALALAAALLAARALLRA